MSQASRGDRPGAESLHVNKLSKLSNATTGDLYNVRTGAIAIFPKRQLAK
jgi:hypothetical protein